MGIANNFASNIQSIATTKDSARYMSGARCILKINGRLVGFAFSVSWEIQTLADEIYGIDDYLPQDIAPNKIRVTGTLSQLHIPGRGPSVEFHQANIGSFLHQKYIGIEVRDSATDWVLFKANKVLVTMRREDVKAEQLANITLNWVAIGFMDELEPVPMAGNGDAKDSLRSIKNDGGYASDIKDKVPKVPW